MNNSISIKIIDCFELDRKQARKSNCTISINQKKKIISIVQYLKQINLDIREFFQKLE